MVASLPDLDTNGQLCAAALKIENAVGCSSLGEDRTSRLEAYNLASQTRTCKEGHEIEGFDLR